MAVQAAPLPPPHHPFGPFGFPAADFGALVEKSCYGDGGALLLLEGGVGGATDGSSGALGGCNEAADFREATRELLSFIDSASSNIKLALDKPGKSKRKVNHRKYLQKQIKRCTGLLGGNAEAAPGTVPCSVPGPAAAVPIAASKQASASASTAPSSGGGAALSSSSSSCKLPPPAKRESKSLAALFDSWRSPPFQPGGAPTTAVATADAAPAGLAHGPSGQDHAAAVPPSPLACKKVPLRNRNLPRSFFTEPAPNRAPNPAGMEGGAAPSVAEELFELLTAPDYRALLQESAEPPPAVFPGSALQAAAELPLEPSLYEPLPSLAPLLYAETPLRPLPALYAAVAAAVSDPAAPFFADCPLPPPPAMPYDYGYSRGAPYPSL